MNIMPQTLKDIMSAPIPLSVVMFLIVQTMGFVWWGSNIVNGISARVSSVEMTVAQITKVTESQASHEGRIIVLEQMSNRIRDDLAEIKTILRGRYGDNPQGSQP